MPLSAVHGDAAGRSARACVSGFNTPSCTPATRRPSLRVRRRGPPRSGRTDPGTAKPSTGQTWWPLRSRGTRRHGRKQPVHKQAQDEITHRSGESGGGGGAGLRCCSSPAEASLRGANHGRREESIGAKVKPKVKLGPRRSSGGGVQGAQGGDPRRRRTNPTPPLTSLEPASPPAEFTIARGRRSGPLGVRTRSTPTEISPEPSGALEGGACLPPRTRGLLVLTTFSPL